MRDGTASVVCRFQYSGRPRALVAGLGLATLLLVAATPAPAVARALAAAWTVAMALAAARGLPLARGRGPRAVALRAAGEIAVQSAAGRWQAGVLRDGCFVAPWLVIVRWRPEGARRDRTVLILPGTAPADQLRNIRVILRWR